jgi:hypothetical protein
MQRCVRIATKSVHYFRRFEFMNELAVTFYIYRYNIYIKVTSKHARNRMQRCFKIATKSVHYFRRFEVMNELAVTFLYI